MEQSFGSFDALSLYDLICCGAFIQSLVSRMPICATWQVEDSSRIHLRYTSQHYPQAYRADRVLINQFAEAFRRVMDHILCP